MKIQELKRLIIMSSVKEFDKDDITFEENIILGYGAMAEVLKAKLKTSQEIVAIKKFLKRDEESLSILKEEARIMGNLQHKNVIQFKGMYLMKQDENNIYHCLVFEFASYGSMFDCLRKHKENFDEKDHLKWLQDIANGLQYLHCNAPSTILHRDLKPQNVLIMESKNAKISDFGFSKVHSHSTVMPEGEGTVHYMAPERIRDESAGLKSDIWSFGALTYEVATGKIPFHSCSTRIAVFYKIGHMQKPLQLPDECPQYLKTILANCMKIVPKERWSIEDLVNHLSQIDLDAASSELERLKSDSSWLSSIEPETLSQEENEELEALRKNKQHAYGKLREYLLNEVSQEDFDRLQYFLNGGHLPRKIIAECKTVLDLLAQLEDHGKLGPDNVELIAEFASDVNRDDWKKHMETYLWVSSGNSEASSISLFETERPSPGLGEANPVSPSKFQDSNSIGRTDSYDNISVKGDIPEEFMEYFTAIAGEGALYWRRMGRFLRVPNEDIEAIGEQRRFTMRDQMLQVLYYWAWGKMENGGRPDKDELTNALYDAQLKYISRMVKNM